MTRKNVVGIVHDFLRTELKEADDIDIVPAYVLQDLFDCRVCAGHIMQLYVKGIMDGVCLPDGRMIFDGEREVSPAELSEIMVRVCFPEFRTPRKQEATLSRGLEEPEELSPEQAIKLMQREKNVLLVDVRTGREYEQGHLENARNIPLLDIIKNPFVLSESREKSLLLYCNEGVQSKAAAQCLLEAGYKMVAFFAWQEGK